MGGWSLVKVNDGFDTLVNALGRADRKGYLPDSLIEPWEAFDYEHVATAPKAEPVQVYQCPHCATSMEVDPTAKPYKATKAEQPPVQEPVGVLLKQHGVCWYAGKKPTAEVQLYAEPQPSDDARDAARYRLIRDRYDGNKTSRCEIMMYMLGFEGDPTDPLDVHIDTVMGSKGE